MAKVTAILLTLPMVAAAALLHFPVAWLIHRLYRRTPFSWALDEYRKQIKCKPLVGPDASHPHNQGLQVLTLGGLWKHFESSFVLASSFFPRTVIRSRKGSGLASFPYVYTCHVLFHVTPLI